MKKSTVTILLEKMHRAAHALQYVNQFMPPTIEPTAYTIRVLKDHLAAIAEAITDETFISFDWERIINDTAQMLPENITYILRRRELENDQSDDYNFFVGRPPYIVLTYTPDRSDCYTTHVEINRSNASNRAPYYVSGFYTHDYNQAYQSFLNRR